MNKLFGTKSEPPSSEDTVARNEELAAELAMEAEESESYSASYTATSNSSDQIKEQSMNIERTAKRSFIVALCVVLMGAAASAGFLYIGIATANKKQEESFERRASDLANEIESSWRDYETTALWIHESCRNWRTSNFTHRDFRILYEYIVSGGLDFNAAEWVPNVTHAERETIENAGYEFFYVQPELPFEKYHGFQGYEPNPENPDELVLSQSSKQDFYFPIQFIEPLYGNDTDGYHLDLYSTPWERPTIDNAINKWEPTLTPRFRMTVDPPDEKGYTVVLYHPGNKLSEDLDIKPRDLSNLVIKVNALLSRAARLQSNALGAYLYDTTIVEARDDEDPPAEFLGGLKIKVEGSHNEGKAIEYVTEVAYDDLRQSSKKLYFEKEIKIGSRYWKIVVLPVDDSYKANVTFVILTGVLIFGSAMLLAIWMVNNTYKSIQMHRVMTKAAAEAAIVTNLFPADVRERMIKDAVAKNNRVGVSRRQDIFLNNGKGKPMLSRDILNSYLTSEGIFGSKAIAELYPYTTVMFADMVGFTAWSSVREPSQVFQLLEIVYNSFDNIAKRRRVFKVETIGDCYVAVAGLPEPRSDHAVVMSRFATDCMFRMQKLVKALETTLGPDTGELDMRIGLHSGQVTAGVLRGDKGRFQLFGDTVNTCARMESTGAKHKIQISQETAALLMEAGRGSWCIPREDKIVAKGKGELETYWLKVVSGSRASKESRSSDSVTVESEEPNTQLDSKTQRLVDWNVMHLSNLLKKILAWRQATAKRSSQPNKANTYEDSMVLDEVKEIITLPGFDVKSIEYMPDESSIELDPEVVAQLRDLVAKIAKGYHDNPFHCFEHASHVCMSVMKMMSRITDPKELVKKKSQDNIDEKQLAKLKHQHTFGITSDPLTQFSCAFSALIHDLDHQGVPNFTLVNERSPLADKYNNKSVAEQNSVDLAWALLLSDDYDELRACICCDDEEYSRFRSLVVNSVMATDIMDKQLGQARKDRWNKAFNVNEDIQTDNEKACINRKATIVIEHLIQASDVSHTMQHWNVYVKWNQRLFNEMYKAYKAGRLEKDPSDGWHEGELGFFDFYIIPLAKKLFTCGVFGVSSDEYLNYALNNRKEWEQKGAEMVEKYLVEYKNAYENKE